MNKLIIFAFLLLISVTLCETPEAASDLICKNPYGSAIPWFSQIKFPKSIQHKQEFKSAYFDSEKTNEEFDLMAKQVSEEGDAIYQTLHAANQNDNIIAIAWNDQPPVDAKKESKTSDEASIENNSHSAHSKCILVMDLQQKKGFIIVHSIPKFPKIANNKFVLNNYEDNQNTYGQSMLCLSLTSSTLNDLAEQILIENPLVYYTKNIDKLDSSYSSIIKLAQQNYASAPHDSIFNFPLIDNTQFKVFFKSGKKPFEPIFETYMIPHLKTSLLTETWGRPYMPSNCSVQGQYFVKNIQQLNFGTNRLWKHTQDHSKWCITSSEQNPYICFGGMNRMTSQGSRGGSMYCSHNIKLYRALIKKIALVEECPANNLNFLQRE